MKVYVGQTRSARLIRELTELGFGECTQPREYPPRRRPWFQDNGAFAAWRAKKAFDASRFSGAVASAIALGDRPDFTVAPDMVAAGAASLALSVSWVPKLRNAGELALVVQDGMGESEVLAALGPFRRDIRRWNAPVETRDGRAVGAVRAQSWAAMSHRTGRHSATSCMGAAHRCGLDRFVSAAVERGTPCGLRRSSARRVAAALDGVVTP